MDKKEIIQALKGASDTPELDVRFFLEDCPSPSEKEIKDFIMRRQSGEPVAKILGHCGFWNLDFLVSKDTLDPRPDSETLIEAVLENYPNHQDKIHFLDIGTGSGCLLLTLLSQYPYAVGIGIDKSEAALKIAKQNAIRLALKTASFKQSDFMKKNWINCLEKFDVIVSNPPYIPTKEISCLDKPVQCFDPLTALDGGIDGLDAYRALAKTIGFILKPEGKIFFEIGKGQENAVCEIMATREFKYIKSYRDLGKITRILMFQKN